MPKIKWVINSNLLYCRNKYKHTRLASTIFIVDCEDTEDSMVSGVPPSGVLVLSS